MLLKKPIPALTRRIGASACIAVLIGAVSFASWAAQSGNQPIAQAPKIQLGELQNIAPSENVTYRRMRPPQYPPDAVKAGVGANVVVKVLVGTEGQAKSADIEKLQLIDMPKHSAEGTAFDQAAVSKEFADVSKAAAMSWVYNPGSKDGKPAGGYVLVPISFILHDCDTDHPCDPPPKAEKQG